MWKMLNHVEETLRSQKDLKGQVIQDADCTVGEKYCTVAQDNTESASMLLHIISRLLSISIT